ncbi:MAG: hypothetical protein C0605_15985, partial [Hyphomicrobiales bacterium]
MRTKVDQIAGMERSELLALWSKMMEDKPPKRLSTPFLRRILAFEAQARCIGGLSPALRKQLEQIGKGIERSKSPILKPGARLVREWNGISHVVDVSEDGYLWLGDKIAILKDGALSQVGKPEDILLNPADDYVE